MEIKARFPVHPAEIRSRVHFTRNDHPSRRKCRSTLGPGFKIPQRLAASTKRVPSSLRIRGIWQALTKRLPWHLIQRFYQRKQMERMDSTRRRLVSHRERVVLFEATRRVRWPLRERADGKDGGGKGERGRERGGSFSFDEIRPSCCELAVWSR